MTEETAEIKVKNGRRAEEAVSVMVELHFAWTIQFLMELEILAFLAQSESASLPWRLIGGQQELVWILKEERNQLERFGHKVVTPADVWEGEPAAPGRSVPRLRLLGMELKSPAFFFWCLVVIFQKPSVTRLV